MTRCAALLRAINVGGRRVTMDALRSLFEQLGCVSVATVAASGNVLFDVRGASGRALEQRIEAALEKALGFAVETFVRTAEQMAAIAVHEPFGPRSGDDGLYIGFMHEPLAADAGARLQALE